MIKDTKQWLVKAMKELQKHAERDDCYSCKELLDFELAKRFAERDKTTAL